MTAFEMIREEIARLDKLRKKCAAGSAERRGYSIAIDGYMKILERLNLEDKESDSID